MQVDVQQYYDALLQWVSATKGSFVGPIAPHQFADTGRGIMAQHDLHAGQRILTIPVSLLMDTRSATQSNQLQAALHGLALPDEEVCVSTGATPSQQR